MGNSLVLDRQAKNSENSTGVKSIKSKSRIAHTEENLVQDTLVSEVDENFVNYLSWHGLKKEDLLILSSTQHYYYDYEELKGVKTLINLKKLNFVSNLDEFLKTLYSGLSPETNFIGCFSDGKRDKDNLPARCYRKFIDFIDARTNIDIDKKDVSRLLEANGFKVIDMTEINGLIYFRTKNLSRIA
jgi:hypothetical protein